MTSSCRLGLVIPAYNEAGRIETTLREVVAFLRSRPYAWRLLVSDDGSSDDTAAIVRTVMREVPELDLLSSSHRGKAFAVRAGVLRTDARYIVFTDADLAVPINELDRLLTSLEAGADVVIGSREASGARRFDEPPYRHLMGRIFSALYRVLILPGIEDAQCGFKGFRGEVAHALFSHLLLYGDKAPVVRGGLLTGFDVELLYLARRWGLKIEDVPVDWYYGAGSKVRPTRDVPKMIMDVLKIRWHALAGDYARRLPGP